ncbi:MAG: hypothetical protein KBS68_04690 [Clostridiales bacterium]|nr:hypothetical protein [Candidatus Crickella merdequi]
MRIEVLYPEICNLYGELGNIRCLKESLPDAEIIETHIKDKPVFLDEEVNLVYMGTMTERGQVMVIDALNPYKDVIKERIHEGMPFLVTGNAFEVFGKEIIEDNVKVADGLGLFDFVSRRSSIQRVNHLYVGDFRVSEEETIKVAGFKSLFGYAYGPAFECKLFDTVLGYGANEEIKEEGIRCHNFMATYLTGPLLILNPPFTKWLMNELMGAKDAVPAHYDAAMDAYNYRIEEYLRPGKGWKYH